MPSPATMMTPSCSSAAGPVAEPRTATPVEIVPDFNRYDGAQVLGGVSQMIRTVASSRLHSRIHGTYAGPLYTADWKRDRRRYN